MLGNKRPRPGSKGPAARDAPRGAAATGAKPAGKKTAGGAKESAAELGALSFDELLKGKFSGDVASETKPVGKPTKSAQPQLSRAPVSAPAPAAKRGVPAKGGAAAPPLKGRRVAEEPEDEENDSEEESADVEAEVAADASDTEGSEDEAGSDEEGSGSEDDDALPDMATFKKQLASMAGSDPDFYSFLRHNDRKLVAAAEAESDEEDGAGEEDEEAEGEEEASDDAEDEGALDAAAEYEEGGVEEPEAEEEEVWDPRAEKKAAAAAAKGKTGKVVAAGEEEEEEEEGLDGAVEGPPSLTTGMARAILKSAFEDKTFRGLARALHAYRACCFMGMSSDILQQLGLAPTHRQQQRGKGAAKREGKGDKPGDRSARRHTAEDDDEDADGARRRSVTLRYRIASSGVFMSVVTAMLEQAAGAFAAHLGRRKGEAKGTPVPAAVAAGGPAARAPLAEYAGWAKLEPLVRSFLTATVELLRQAKDAGLRLFVLRALRPYIPYLQTLTPLTKRYTKVLLGLFAGAGAGASTGAASPAAEPEQAQSLIVASFLRLRQMGAVLPHPTLDAVLKGLYRAFVGQAKFMSEEGAAGVLVQSHCVAEAFGVDEVAAYQHAFLYLRQLALQLRQALTTKSKEAVLVVYSWQYINCCRLWSSVLSRYATDPAKPLFQLVFPLTQILLGVARLVPTPRFYPLRLHVVGMLIELSWATRVYIPYLPLLLDILASPILTAKPSGVAATKPPALAFMVKVGKSTIGTRAFTDALVNKTLDLLLDGCKAHYHSVALPEVVLPVLHALRTFAKTTRAAAWRGRARAIVDALVSQSAKVAAKRAALPAAPSDRAAIATFMRAEGEAAAADRLRLREAAAASSLQEAQSRAEAARKEATALAAAERRAGKLRAKRGADEGGDEDDEEEGAEGEEDEYSSGDDAEYGQFLKPSAAKRRRAEEEGDDEEEEDGEEEDEDEEEGSGAGARASGKQVRFGGASAAAGAGSAGAASAARAAFASKHAAAAVAGGKGKASAKPAAKAAPAPRKKGEDLVEDLDLDDL